MSAMHEQSIFIEATGKEDPAERAAFLEAYGRAHPGRLRASHRETRTRTIAVTVPDLGDDKKNRALEQLVIDLAAQLARYAESVG